MRFDARLRMPLITLLKAGGIINELPKVILTNWNLITTNGNLIQDPRLIGLIFAQFTIS